MFKVIVERPRVGHADKRKRLGRARPLEDEEGAPLRARVSDPKAFVKTKYLNENLAPLRRYLERQAGRPWNKVYSELSAQLRVSSTVQQHVRDHLEDFVARACRMENGEVLTAGRWGGEATLERDGRAFFVHPRTGLLKRNPHYRSWGRRWREAKAAHAQERAQRLRVVDDKTVLLRLKDDVWWEVKLAKIGDGSQPDVVLAAGLSDLEPRELYNRPGVRARDKRVLSKAEKRRFGLK